MNEEKTASQNEVIPPPPNKKDIPKIKEGTQVPKVPRVSEPYHPKRYPIKSYLGIITIAKREFFANLKSVRMLVLMLLFILAVLGGSYGISGLSSSTQSLPDVEVLAWAILEDNDGFGNPDDLLVMITDGDGISRPNVKVEYLSQEDEVEDIYFNGFADSNGIIIIYNVSSNLVESNFFRITFDNIEHENVRIAIAFEFSPPPAYILSHTLDLDNDNILDDALVMVLDKSGGPIVNVNVSISNSDYQDSQFTDSNGLVKLFNLEAGEGDAFSGFKPQEYHLEVTYLGETSTNEFLIYQDDETAQGIFDLEGPNEIIYLIAVLFITMLGPIIAIALSFDSITKEKIQKSMDFLLARPMGRRGIIIGKFLGILLAIIIPVTAINLLAVGLISSVTNQSPDGTFIAGFMIYTIIFIAIYILLQQIFSILAKTTGTAILSGISIWLIFNLFWSLISLAIGAAMGLQLGSDDWISMSNQMSLVNPGGAYPLALAYLLPTQEGTSTSVLGISSWMPATAMIIWFIVTFFLATEIFVRKADS
jgi:ABC-type transport system involved in multi-copper enzyme maturation permease subunit